jgi:large subunit ribosomal protein L15
VGYGQVGQHRKHSQKGGRKVGRHKHLFSYVIRYEPDYFGNKGFTSPKALKQHVNVINVGSLEGLVDKLEAEKTLETKDDKPFLDLEKHGYQKLLANGKITKPIIIKVASHSTNAAKKIEAAGGQILGAAPEEEEFEEVKEESEETAAKD